MLREIIVLHGPKVIIALTIVFACIKLIKLVDVAAGEERFSLFMRSLFPYSRQEIRNTFNHGLKQYYIYSNRVNKIYYVIGVLLVGAYAFMVSIA